MLPLKLHEEKKFADNYNKATTTDAKTLATCHTPLFLEKII